MIRVLIKPARQWFGRRQWAFEIRAANGERIHPNDTYHNRLEAVGAMELLFGGSETVELVVQDRFGGVEERRMLR